MWLRRSFWRGTCAAGVAVVSGENRWGPEVFWQSGAEFKGGWGFAGGPRKDDWGGERPPGGVSGVSQSCGLRVPTTPGTNATKGGTIDGKGCCSHAAKAVPCERAPRGVGQETVE